MSFSLPQASDALREEARVIREAADRASESMLLCMDAVRQGHATIKRLADALKDIRGAAGLDDPLIVGANPLVFERMGRIYQTADAALASQQNGSKE